MKISELYNYMEKKIPTGLSEEWDNDGLMLLADDKEVSNVLVALDVTPDVRKKAVTEGYDLIITHHPLIFRPLKSISAPAYTELIKNNVSVFSFHTRLDTMTGGVNDEFARLLGLENVESFQEMGRIGLIEETDFDSFAKFVKEVLGCERINYVKRTETVKKVALLGGGGKSFWESTKDAADVYITGEMSHDTFLDAYAEGVSVIEAGHFYTEFPVCRVIASMVKEADPGIHTDIMKDYPVKTI